MMPFNYLEDIYKRLVNSVADQQYYFSYIQDFTCAPGSGKTWLDANSVCLGLMGVLDTTFRQR